MTFFPKSACSKCASCKCCCCANEGVTVTTRKYTYTGENEDWDNGFANTEFVYTPTERIVLKDEYQPQLFYNQIDTEFYAKNILDHVPLVSYANRPFFRKIDEETQISKYSLPTVSYVADPVYIRRKEQCRFDCVGKPNCLTCCCCSTTNTKN